MARDGPSILVNNRKSSDEHATYTEQLRTQRGSPLLLHHPRIRLHSAASQKHTGRQDKAGSPQQPREKRLGEVDSAFTEIVKRNIPLCQRGLGAI